MDHFAYSLLLLALGWLLNSATGGIMLRVRRPHRLGDAAHVWDWIGGKLCAFTMEQIKVAHDRACHLAPPRWRWLRPSLWIAALLVLSVLAFTGCGYAKHRDPEVRTYATTAEAKESARLHANDAGGTAWSPNACCGSMLPLIIEGDILVTVRTPYAKLLGKVAVYGPKWNDGKPVAHRLVAQDSGGYIASGDNVPQSENWERVTEANYVGEVIAIYRVKP
jgi:hypothetical protein